MKKLLLFVFIILVSIVSVSASTFNYSLTTLDASFTTGYEDIGGVYDDTVDTFYIFGGDTTPASTNIIRSYNKTSDTYNNSVSTLPENMFFGQEACINRWGTGESYCYGGRSTQLNTNYNKIVKFTSNNNSAVWIDQNLSEEKYFGCAVYDNKRDQAYFFGGYNPGATSNVNTIEIHNFTNNSVSVSNVTMGAKLGQLGCFYDTLNDYVVIMGGTEYDVSYGYYPKTQIYYPNNDTLEVLGSGSNLPYNADSLNCEYMESDGNGYCFGSIPSSYFAPYTYRDDVIKWNSTGKSWSITSFNILDAVEDFPAVLDRSTNDSIYLFGVLQAGSSDNDVSRMTETQKFSAIENVVETNNSPEFLTYNITNSEPIYSNSSLNVSFSLSDNNITTNVTVTWYKSLDNITFSNYSLDDETFNNITLGSVINSNISTIESNKTNATEYWKAQITAVNEFNTTIVNTSVIYISEDPLPSILITDITVSEITNISSEISWATDLNTTNNTLYYGLASDNLSNSIFTNSTLNNHAINLTNLTASTIYYYKIVSYHNGSLFNESSVYSFTTSSNPSPSPPPSSSGGGGSSSSSSSSSGTSANDLVKEEINTTIEQTEEVTPVSNLVNVVVDTTEEIIDDTVNYFVSENITENITTTIEKINITTASDLVKANLEITPEPVEPENKHIAVKSIVVGLLAFVLVYLMFSMKKNKKNFIKFKRI